ncbi:MAG: zinc ribbon domain-containing protein [Peptoniphilus sp.]|nr:zinc ribbon domain-containing protein [Peptoniphilus sp.]MDD7363265.1 zinc ribbon domain-containing protein [Bacillota bacterium]MDY6045358.1 zinc ribbon domain-containing protein [Peptoniphilus sp.]
MYCSHCGKKLNPDNRFCTSCGSPNPYYDSEDVAQKTAQRHAAGRGEERPRSRPEAYEHNPMYAAQAPGTFNWGAFSLTIPWGIGNRCYICLLALIPGLNIIMSFIAGFSGNAWAMNNNDYRDIEEFSRIQETWNHAGFIFFIIAVIPFAFLILLSLLNLLTIPSISNNFL